MPLPSSGLPFALFAVGLAITLGGWIALMAVLFLIVGWMLVSPALKHFSRIRS